MWGFHMFHSRFNQIPPASSTTWTEKGNMRIPWTLWLCLLSMMTAALNERCHFGREEILKWRIYKEKSHGGFLPPMMRHEHVIRFVACAANKNVDLHKTFHRGTEQTDDTLDTFVGVEGRLHGAVIAPPLYFSHQSFSFGSLFRCCLFFCVYFFIHTPDGHLLYMFNWIILYVPCKKKMNLTSINRSITCRHKD